MIPGSLDAMLPVRIWIGVGVGAALTAAAWWLRERRVRQQYEQQRILHGLAEDIIAAPTQGAIAEKLATVLPTITHATSVNVFLHQRRTRSLERIPTSAEPEPMAASLDSPPEGLANAAVVCFRNRTPLQIPDVRRNPLVKVGPKMSLPRSAMFVPLFSQQEILGVLELGNARKTGFFPAEEQADVQHLANQAAAALRLQDRQAMREQLFHSEKLAATGQLISGVASELRAPIEDIVRLSASLAAHAGYPPSTADLLKLSSESQRASEIVSRLVSFAREDDPPAGALVDVNQITGELVRFREPEWKALGIQAQYRLSQEAAPVQGFHRQIEQAVLNLIVHAEHCASHATVRTLSLQTSVISARAVVEISYASDTEGTSDPFSSASMLDGDSLGLAVCQGIIRSHGGEIRFRWRTGIAKFEIEFPLAQNQPQPAPAAKPEKPARALTLMVVDQEAAAQRQLIAMLTARGHRGVPVSPQEAADLAQRLRFDAVFWSIHSGVSPWTEFYDVIRAQTSTFVLVGAGWDPELARRLEENHDFLLARPIQELEIERILAAAEARPRPAVT